MEPYCIPSVRVHDVFSFGIGPRAERTQTGRTSNRPQEGHGDEEGACKEDLCWRAES